MGNHHLRSGGRYPVLRSIGILYLYLSGAFVVSVGNAEDPWWASHQWHPDWKLETWRTTRLRLWLVRGVCGSYATGLRPWLKKSRGGLDG